LGRSLREPCLQVGVEVNFHALKIRYRPHAGNRAQRSFMKRQGAGVPARGISVLPGTPV
jgi:hypothetical protein